MGAQKHCKQIGFALFSSIQNFTAFHPSIISLLVQVILVCSGGSFTHRSCKYLETNPFRECILQAKQILEAISLTLWTRTTVPILLTARPLVHTCGERQSLNHLFFVRHSLSDLCTVHCRSRFPSFPHSFLYTSHPRAFYGPRHILLPIGRARAGRVFSSDEPFGGLNVILVGDFHQFPPVASAGTSALYVPSNPSKDSALAMLGRKLYEQFDVVVRLTI